MHLINCLSIESIWHRNAVVFQPTFSRIWICKIQILVNRSCPALLSPPAHGGLHFRVLNFGRFHFGSLICGGLTCGKIDLQEDWPAGRLHFGGMHFEWLTCGELTCGGLTCGGLICRISEKISLILGIAQNIFAQNPFDACSLSIAQYPYNLKLLALKISAGYKIPSILKSLASQSLLGRKSLRSKSLLGKIPLFKIPSCFLIQNPFAQNPYWIIKINLW